MTQTPGTGHPEKWLSDSLDGLHNDLGVIARELGAIRAILLSIAQLQTGTTGDPGAAKRRLNDIASKFG